MTEPFEDHNNEKQKRAQRRKTKRNVITKDLHTSKYHQRIKPGKTYKRLRKQDIIKDG